MYLPENRNSNLDAPCNLKLLHLARAPPGRNFVSLSVMKRARTVAFISEYSAAFTAAMRDGAKSTAQDLGLQIVANIGIKKLDCEGAT